MHCMLMDLLHGFEVLSTTEETLFNSRNVSRLVQNKTKPTKTKQSLPNGSTIWILGMKLPGRSFLPLPSAFEILRFSGSCITCGVGIATA